MKRLIALLLILVLLAGCTVQQPEPSTEPTTEATDPTTESTLPPGAPLYIRDSELEQQTGGAVKAYDVHKDSIALYSMGENLLVYFPYRSNADHILIYGGEELYLRGMKRADSSLLPGNLGVQISDNGISYYNESAGQIVMLDAMLNETNRIDLPEGAQGIPVVDHAHTTAYYCTENEIRALDLTTGIARLLRQEAVAWQSLMGITFDGSVLLCDVIDENQRGYIAYINTENGKLVDQDTFGWQFTDYGDAFLLTNDAEALYGTWSSDVMHFVPAGENTTIWPALALGGAVASRVTETGLVLDFYALDSGARTASVTLPGGAEAYAVVGDTKRQCVWFLMTDTEGNKTLCAWDYRMTPVTDETVYLLPRYTELMPDTEGLTACQAEADILGAAHGMEIRIWKNAVSAPWEDLRSDYRVASFRDTLSAMEQVLDTFPEGMVAKLASVSDTGVTSVSLVRGEERTAQSHFKWVDVSAYIALETGENGEAAFCNALYRVMDTYILNSNSILDEWDSKEPVNDRAMIFQYAMTEGMEDYFEGKAAQSKLKQLCKAIRDAFDLKNYEGELLWEQYLR